MKANKKHYISKYFVSINLPDKMLIVLMVILLVQLIFGLFIRPVQNEKDGRIDVVIRTSAASIFGYFLSSNFLNRERSKEKLKRERIVTTQSVQTCNLDQVRAEVTPEIKDGLIQNVQIYIAAFIGIISLVVLFVVRNDPNLDGRLMEAGITQFRDFFASSLGFLLGDMGKRD